MLRQNTISPITVSIQREEGNWFDKLSREEQRSYIEKHPNSKYAQDKMSKSKPVPSEKKKVKKKAKKFPVASKPLSKNFRKKLDKQPKEVKEFFESEGHKANSKKRAKVKELAVKSSKHLAKGVKKSFTSWKEGALAIKKIAKGEKVTGKELLTIGKLMLMTASTVATAPVVASTLGVGTLAAGIGATGVAATALTQTAMAATFTGVLAARTAMSGAIGAAITGVASQVKKKMSSSSDLTVDAKYKDMSEDEILEDFVMQIGDVLATADFTEEEWALAFNMK